jgi:hypothetical protein
VTHAGGEFSAVGDFFLKINGMTVLTAESGRDLPHLKAVRTVIGSAWNLCTNDTGLFNFGIVFQFLRHGH